MAAQAFPDNPTYMYILAINPGSTSTKIAVYDDEKPILLHTIHHSVDELSAFVHLTDQYAFRKDLILAELRRVGIPFRFDAIIGRGALTKPITGGVYEINEAMRRDAEQAPRKHACNLGCLIAAELAAQLPGCRALTADPVVVDELDDIARLTGSPLLPRRSIWHALNQRAIARRYAREHGLHYEDLNLIVCHLGGGITVAAHRQGRAVDVNNGLDGEGPMSPERAGTLPTGELINLCFSGRFTREELLRRVSGHAGLVAYLGTTDMKEILARIEAGDEQARLVVDAMIFQIAKAIGAEATVLYGKVDAILITGGIAYAPYITQRIRERVRFIAPVAVFPGQDEMQALALNALGALRGELEVKTYA